MLDCDASRGRIRLSLLFELQKREQSLIIKGHAVIAKAEDIATHLGEDMADWKGTQGWLHGFKKRNGIHSFKLHGEAKSADMDGVRLAREVLPGLIEEKVGSKFFKYVDKVWENVG